MDLNRKNMKRLLLLITFGVVLAWVLTHPGQAGGLLSVFRMGITGYILSNVIADALAAVFLFAVLTLWRCFRMASLNRGLIRNMFRYCLPLIPATVCSWIINISDRYFISYMLGADVSGLYAVANKISTIMLIISNIFTSAWQLSAMDGRPRDGPGRSLRREIDLV